MTTEFDFARLFFSMKNMSLPLKILSTINILFAITISLRVRGLSPEGVSVRVGFLSHYDAFDNVGV
jgi:hypothetical protein